MAGSHRRCPSSPGMLKPRATKPSKGFISLVSLHFAVVGIVCKSVVLTRSDVVAGVPLLVYLPVVRWHRADLHFHRRQRKGLCVHDEVDRNVEAAGGQLQTLAIDLQDVCFIDTAW